MTHETLCKYLSKETNTVKDNIIQGSKYEHFLGKKHVEDFRIRNLSSDYSMQNSSFVDTMIKAYYKNQGFEYNKNLSTKAGMFVDNKTTILSITKTYIKDDELRVSVIEIN